MVNNIVKIIKAIAGIACLISAVLMLVNLIFINSNGLTMLSIRIFGVSLLAEVLTVLLGRGQNNDNSDVNAEEEDNSGDNNDSQE